MVSTYAKPKHEKENKMKTFHEMKVHNKKTITIFNACEFGEWEPVKYGTYDSEKGEWSFPTCEPDDDRCFFIRYVATGKMYKWNQRSRRWVYESQQERILENWYLENNNYKFKIELIQKADWTKEIPSIFQAQCSFVLNNVDREFGPLIMGNEFANFSDRRQAQNYINLIIRNEMNRRVAA